VDEVKNFISIFEQPIIFFLFLHTHEQLFAIIDTETTGGNPAKDRVMEIAIIIHNGKRVIEQFATLINPETPIMPFVVSLTGISNDMVKDAPTFQEVAERIFQMTENKIFVAHNARFDYGILRGEFKRIGIRFNRKQLCTVKLARQIIPGYKSYSLGKICKDLDIDIDSRHRAFGDAEATARLFEKLMMNDRKELIRSMLEEELQESAFPPNLSKELVDDLPEETGVYYFLDEKGKPIYIGKSRNIRKRVISHFYEDLESPRFSDLKQKVFDISYELTGSELIAMILESNEIRKYFPPFNIAQRRKKYRYGIYQHQDENGFINLKIELLKQDEKPIIEFTNRKSANVVMSKFIEKYSLYPSLCGYGNPENTKPEMPSEIYNLRVSKVTERYRYKKPNFFIISEGKSHHQQSVVWIEDNTYKGFGYFEPEYIENDIESLKEVVQPQYDDPDVHRIIRAWLGKKTKDEIIAY
jgi:DNA polymerase III subunit epsilon